MIKDKGLEELFLAAKPSFCDYEQFEASLNKRLDAVEYLKQHEEACLRRYRNGIFAAFALGVICGGLIISFILDMPADIPLFTVEAESCFLLFIQEYSIIIATLIISGLLCVGIVNLISAVNDITNMKERVQTILQ
uniref:Uncharacterized protein n=5 Tax=unclassified Prevotella TaxID=2638335 RepID=A0AB33JK87_9BACT